MSAAAWSPDVSDEATPSPNGNGALTPGTALAALKASGLRPTPTGAAHCPVCDPGCTGPRTLEITRSDQGVVGYACSRCPRAAVAETMAVLTDRLCHKPAAIQEISSLLGIPIARIVKRGQAGDAWDLELDDGRTVELGNAKAVLKRTDFEAAIAGVTRRVIPLMKLAEHRELAELIFNAAEYVDATLEVAEETTAWIADFRKGSVVRHLDLADSVAKWELLEDGVHGIGVLRTTDGRLGVRLEALTLWLDRHRRERVAGRELGLRLSRLGFMKEQLAARQGTAVRKARWWISQPGWENEALGVPTFSPVPGSYACAREGTTSRGNGGNTGTPSKDGAAIQASPGNSVGTAGNNGRGASS